MNWRQWVLVAVFAASALINVATIGEPRKPIDNATAAAIVGLSGTLIWLVVTI